MLKLSSHKPNLQVEGGTILHLLVRAPRVSVDYFRVVGENTYSYFSYYLLPATTCTSVDCDNYTLALSHREWPDPKKIEMLTHSVSR